MNRLGVCPRCSKANSIGTDGKDLEQDVEAAHAVREPNMYINALVTFTSVLILASEPIALAMSGGGGLPTLDFQRQCRASQSATDETISGKPVGTFQECLKSERAAREQLIKDWATIPPSDKASCVRPAIYHPSYSEWLWCIELSGATRKSRREHPLPLPSLKPCPIVQWTEDGTIAEVDNCRLGRPMT